MSEKNKYYLTTPIYYLNAEPHIGHALTTIAADVLARHHRLLGDDTFFLTGTDEHGDKNEKIAKSLNMDPKAYVDDMAAKFSAAWAKLDIIPDDFIRTTDERHEKAVVKFFEQLQASGKIYKGEYKGLYCVGHEAYIKETDLVDGLCPDHKTKPEELVEENWFFKLSAYTEILQDMISHDDIKVSPVERKNEVLGFLKQGLEDIAISRPNVSWGIPVPFDPSHTIYVWVDALVNYISALDYAEDGERFKKYWPADLHLVGKDILKFHAIIWPAMLLACKIPTPKEVFAHGYFTVDGQKMSKTIGNVIDPVDWVSKYGADVVRYFLLREVVFGSDGDVSEEKLRVRYTADLANSLGNLFSRLTNMVEKYTNGFLPEVVLSSRKEQIGESLKLTAELKFSLALEKIWEVLAWANQTIDKEKPWELAGKDDAKLHSLLNDLTATLLEVSLALAAYMPETSEKIRVALSAEQIKKAEPLFPRLD